MLRWFHSSTPKGLPRPSGPFSVGFQDFEWCPKQTKYTTEPPSFVLARVYYPSLPITRHENFDDAKEDAWKGRSHWIPSPAYYPGNCNGHDCYGYYC